MIDPNISDYIFGAEMTPEEIADKALAYKAIYLLNFTEDKLDSKGKFRYTTI